jgi:hypothetical protein
MYKYGGGNVDEEWKRSGPPKEQFGEEEQRARWEVEEGAWWDK